ncbi:bifunctional proline dehydrogenase/L-glutamate gamma-semialdehyde dehydrogenase PutA [Altericroceibacterium endophyticum]|uniref:Bifunctional protein PutA n=1 Tax=Altericroceibacterium endophyticum TaxID=1808508 RepID=A0A6I4T7G2_9SPHN|nr:bifunctional proline dehydrogenase/L-glutamate gamma-semialdehyde dehydrogenase PutA [Altericroceibacterium endophyticum]MXO65913.1 bifunctional proline dehydrogenase/L-glutamate gamma-semialdehyde dehydrogenase PutA [Altericroceibacterium endophyticum]
MIDRSNLRAAYRLEEEECVNKRLDQAAPISDLHPTSSAIASKLIEGARKHKANGLDAFLHSYGLATEEGIALMCLAEALLRVPDETTANALIHDKIGKLDWGEHLGTSSSTFVNAATFSLMLTGEVLRGGESKEAGLSHALGRAVGRLGDPVIRRATLQAMRILGGQFVFGRTIDEAIQRGKPEVKKGLTHSYDMLGEAAMTFEDAERYRQSYKSAIARLKQESGKGIVKSPGISVKLSALYPKYDYLHQEEAVAKLVPVVRELALDARDADIHFTIDAEEAERLEPSLDVIEILAADDELFRGGWEGFGMAIQAYQKRAAPWCEWVASLARRYNRKFMIRLVKGAYWDTEIKHTQVGGHDDYPVFTRKVSTDVSFLACAQKLLAASDVIYPAFATHNAYTVGAIKAMAGKKKFEFQRLHGMGEDVYAALAQHEKSAGEQVTPVRLYAPVGGHKDLLAYLVRRLLENGANSSFVNRMADAEVPVSDLVTNPIEELEQLHPKRNPSIPLPVNIFPGRVNSMGVDLADPVVRRPMLDRLQELNEQVWAAAPTVLAGSGGPVREIRSPFDRSQVVGTVLEAAPEDVDLAYKRAKEAQPRWDALGGLARADLLDRTADLFEENMAEFISICHREAGKNIIDGVLEVREAVDFLRFYASEARMLFAAPLPLPGPTGEENRLGLYGRGIFASISPWNFPLAIFTGTMAAPLAAGNTVLAKPAAQTPLVAALATRLCHEAGIPNDVLQLLPGGGDVGGRMTSDERVSGVVFTGSVGTARAINRSLADRDAPIATLIAETGGQNAMIVDSSALPEQVTRDVVASSFQSAGQRCSALRVLYLQNEVADTMLDMIKGAFEALVIGDPRDMSTDVGPVIDEDAREKLEAHVADMQAKGFKVHRRELPEGLENGTFVAPTIIELDSIHDLDGENFGPILHIVRFDINELEEVIEDINSTGFGLTMGLHSRIDATRRRVEAHVKVGNFYVNRNQIGAVVESQPFGGEGLSGTGPKAGGPNYLARFATERVTTIDTTAAGGNASLMAEG